MPGRLCAECQKPLNETSPSSRRFCGARCRDRSNNRKFADRTVVDSDHGKRRGYAKGCRCGDCRRYLAEYSRDYRARQPKTPRPSNRFKGMRIGRRSDEHGTSSAYAYGCRCDDCRRARVVENAEWVRRNPEKFKANQRRYRRKNPREATRQFAPFDDEALEYCELIQDDPCVYCGGRADTIDHIDPVSVSRSSEWSNLAPACRSCNSSKGAKSLLVFLAYRHP